MAARLDNPDARISPWMDGTDLIPPDDAGRRSGRPELDHAIAMLLALAPALLATGIDRRKLASVRQLEPEWHDTVWQAKLRFRSKK